MSEDKEQEQDKELWQMEAYTEAVKSGLYAKKTGLVGKYDNVRRYWEDELTRQFLRAPLQKLIKRCRAQMRRLRIMDLGCGSADGFELLAGMRHRDPGLHTNEVSLLTSNVLGQYTGIDLNRDLIRQGRLLYGENPKMEFRQADFRKGLPLAAKEPSCDLYFSSFGTTSHHNDDKTAVQLLAEIAERCQDYCVVMCDWLGRYSYEWQSLWVNDLSKHRNMDYVVSYIYEKEEREQRRGELQHLNLRLMSRKEADAIVKAASQRAKVEIKPLVWFDRSTFTGRHMDTAEYNTHAQPIRQAVNSLHEANVRTDLSSLLIDYVPKPGFEFLNTYFEQLQMCWNTLVQYTQTLLLLHKESEQGFVEDPPPVPGSYPAALRDMMERMRHVVVGVGWLGIGLPRENIIEPQLGYALRYMVTNMQRGQGCAHGLVGIFEVNKHA
ncbi:MAG: class I SAM-dependent methyltransferase [Kiritimatiellae bacterium]|nr:class I SAM-dependent methyltransferase [Kiritimatiellia bacterium]